MFKDVLGKFAMVYLNDILVFSRPSEEHRDHLRQVLQKLLDNKLCGMLSKCTFMRCSVAFLGHTLSADGLVVDHSTAFYDLGLARPQGRSTYGFLLGGLQILFANVSKGTPR